MTLARVFIPFALGYFLSYLLRNVNAVIAPDLVRELGLTADELGLLTAANFLAFGAFQLPLGILLDKYGPRRTEAVLLLFAALGALIFATAGGTSGLILGRALIGLGTSACLMAAFKAYTQWFQAERLPLVNGCQMVAGGIGAMTATVPIEFALGHTDWRGVFFVFSAIAVTFSAVIYFTVPRGRGTDSVPGTLGDQIAGFIKIFKSPYFWRVTPLTVSSQAAFLGVQSLWAGPWMKDVAQLPRETVADNLFLIACAIIAGFFSWGAMTDRAQRFGIKPMNVALVGMAGFAVVQLAIVAQWTEMTRLVWMVYGFFGTTGIIAYALVPQRFDPSLSGRVVTGMNVLVFLAAFSVQWGMGAIINLWPTSADGAYHPDGYQAAFIAVVAMQAAGLAWYALYRKETTA